MGSSAAIRRRLAGARPRRSAAHPASSWRYRLVCYECGRVEPFDDTGVERALQRLLRDTALRDPVCEVTVTGLCERCAG